MVGRSGWHWCAGIVGCCWVPAGDAGMAEGIAWEGGVPGVWFDTALRGLRAGSPRTGWVDGGWVPTRTVFQKSPYLVLRQAQDQRYRFRTARGEPVERRIRRFD